MESLNNEKKMNSEITSRYTIVIATAKRARQIIDGSTPLVYASSDRAVSIAVNELAEGKLQITANPEITENIPERSVAAMYYKGITSTTVAKDDHDDDSLDEDLDDEAENYGDEEYKEEEYQESYRDEDYSDDIDSEGMGGYPDGDFDNE
jgi:DNA-directed RNA polymerase subunit omega